MKNLVLFVVAALGLVSLSSGQIKLQENFETSDSANLPVGWSKWNEAPFDIDPSGEWFVQDTGRSVPGIAAPRTSVAHSGIKAALVSWYAGIDTNTGTNGQADTWLVTKRIPNVEANDSLIFWAIGGNGGTAGTYYRDTLEVWMDISDSLPVNITLQIATITWEVTDLYGTFKRYALPIGLAAGNDVFVGFRYHTNVSVDGFVVYLDDVQVKGPLAGVTRTDGLPSDVSLSQNYPNPFNPSTTIEWSVPAMSKVSLSIYNSIGQEIATLVNATLESGHYKTTWDASAFPSGVYLYRLQVGARSYAKKLIYLR